MVLAIAAALVMALPALSCGEAETVTQQPAANEASDSAQDRAAKLAAQTQLRNALTDQEMYYTENERYAASASQLKSVDDKLSGKVVVESGTATSYEMSVTANDSAGTKYIVRRTSAGVQRLDGDGNSW